MFQEIPVNEPRIFAFKAVGRLTHDDYQEFLPKLEKILEQEAPLSMLLELENFHGWELRAALDDYHFGMEHQKDFRRIAIVGEGHLAKWMTLLARPFVAAEVRFFEPDQVSEAWDWLREADDTDEGPSITDWRHILVPVDFSLAAEQAVRRAVRIADRLEAKITLLHVVEDLILYDEFYDPIVPSDLALDESLLDAASERMSQLVERLEVPSPHVEVLLGSPKTTILQYIEAQEIDLVVMGAHGRRGLRRLLGSTTNGIVNSARCEVLSVPLYDQAS